MVRTYQGGELVGEKKEPVGSLADWLCTEITYAQELLNHNSVVADVVYLNGRLTALKEVLRELEERRDRNET